MEGSCAVRQGDTTTTTARGLTAGGGGDVDALNVEHDLARWLRDLDTSVSTSSSSPRKPAPPKVASKPCVSPVNTSQQQQPTGSQHDTVADFESILGQLHNLDQLFDNVDAATASNSSPTTGVSSTGSTWSPTPRPAPAGPHASPPSTGGGPPRGNNEFDGCDEVLRGALLELTAIAGSSSPPPSSAVKAADLPLTSPRQNGHCDHRPMNDEPASSSSSSSLSTIASDKSSSVRNGSSSPAGSSLCPPLNMKPAQTPVQVFLPDGVSSHVMVDEQMNTDHLCRLVMKRRNVPLMTSWSILEQLPGLFMERRIEQHEVVLDVMRNWVKGTCNRLMFVENVGRYALYDTDHQGLLVDTVYDGQGPLHVKSDDKKTWKKLDCVLQTSGLCCRSTTHHAAGASAGKHARSSDTTCLQSLADVDIYLAVDWRKKYKSPTEHGIALKPVYVQKKTPRCIKYLCCDNEASLVRWMTALRLAKYGDHLTSCSHGPELSGADQSLTLSPAHVTAAASAVISPAVVEVMSSCSQSAGVVDDQAGSSSTIRRKGSLVPALPITTQTTRLLSQQQSRSGRDDTDGPHQRAETQQSALVPTSPDLPPPPTSANTTVVADPRLLASPVTDSAAGRTTTRAPATPAGQRPTAATVPTPHATPTRTASARGTAAEGSPARPKPAPPKRSETTKLSTLPADSHQTKAFIMNLDRVITLKNCRGSGGLATLPVPLPPRPAYVDGPTYLDTDDLPPPPAELLEGLRSMRRQAMPLPPIPAPGRR